MRITIRLVTKLRLNSEFGVFSELTDVVRCAPFAFQTQFSFFDPDLQEIFGLFLANIQRLHHAAPCNLAFFFNQSQVRLRLEAALWIGAYKTFRIIHIPCS